MSSIQRSIGWGVALIVGLLSGGAVLASDENESEPKEPAASSTVPVDSMDFETPPPPFKDPDIFPCSDCHADLEADPQRRELELMHENIELRHDEEHRWCLDCHDADNRDRLRMANGTLIRFAESYRLCGQCHGNKYRDWRAGVHGRRTGNWDGEKQYLLCVHCHDSHQPRFDPIEPLPAPTHPKEIQ